MKIGTMPEHHDMARTEYGRVAVDFAVAIAQGNYGVARQMLVRSLQDEWSEQRLKQRFERMMKGGPVTEINALEGYDEYPDKPDGDVGGMYVSIGGHEPNEPILTFNEAVMVFVRREAEGLRIRELQWGR
jgi:hypothetical protein